MLGFPLKSLHDASFMRSVVTKFNTHALLFELEVIPHYLGTPGGGVI